MPKDCDNAADWASALIFCPVYSPPHPNQKYVHELIFVTGAWGADDHILHFLPLHHIHGLLNKLICPLRAGASVEFLPSSSPSVIWERILQSDSYSRNALNGKNTHQEDVSFAYPLEDANMEYHVSPRNASDICEPLSSPYTGDCVSPSVFMAVPTICKTLHTRRT